MNSGIREAELEVDQGRCQGQYDDPDPERVLCWYGLVATVFFLSPWASRLAPL